MFCLNNIYFIFQIFYLNILILFIFIPIITLSSFPTMSSLSTTPTKSNSSCSSHGWFSALWPGPSASGPKKKNNSDYSLLSNYQGQRHLESFHVTNAKLSTNLKAMVIIEFLLQALRLSGGIKGRNE